MSTAPYTLEITGINLTDLRTSAQECGLSLSDSHDLPNGASITYRAPTPDSATTIATTLLAHHHPDTATLWQGVGHHKHPIPLP